MSILRAMVIAIALFLLAGCTHLYSHEFLVEPLEPMSQKELREVFASFRAYLSSKGMVELKNPANRNPDIAGFAFGSGRSGLLRQPFEDYLQLAYSDDKGFTLTIVRIIDQPIDFSDQYIREFKTKTEEFIEQASSKKVRVQVIVSSRP